MHLRRDTHDEDRPRGIVAAGPVSSVSPPSIRRLSRSGLCAPADGDVAAAREGRLLHLADGWVMRNSHGSFRAVEERAAEPHALTLFHPPDASPRLIADVKALEHDDFMKPPLHPFRLVRKRDPQPDRPFAPTDLHGLTLTQSLDKGLQPFSLA